MNEMYTSMQMFTMSKLENCLRESAAQYIDAAVHVNIFFISSQASFITWQWDHVEESQHSKQAISWFLIYPHREKTDAEALYGAKIDTIKNKKWGNREIKFRK